MLLKESKAPAVVDAAAFSPAPSPHLLSPSSSSFASSSASSRSPIQQYSFY